ncbi:hypothetical protein [Hyphomicrobium sp. 2TAF46]|uniref:hypothetical protein n=1 Tax=Hyphomicrobium sp. 2TAF46 TaxID=3233019 RepID=UPI003F9259AB
MGHDTSKASWSGLWTWLDRVGMAAEYDPLEELQARVLRLEDEISLLRRDPNRALSALWGDPKRRVT